MGITLFPHENLRRSILMKGTNFRNTEILWKRNSVKKRCKKQKRWGKNAKKVLAECTDDFEEISHLLYEYSVYLFSIGKFQQRRKTLYSVLASLLHCTAVLELNVFFFFDKTYPVTKMYSCTVQNFL